MSEVEALSAMQRLNCSEPCKKPSVLGYGHTKMVGI
jgi:hypothetical protein